jgi:hypothetical protein
MANRTTASAALLNFVVSSGGDMDRQVQVNGPNFLQAGRPFLLE